MYKNGSVVDSMSCISSDNKHTIHKIVNDIKRVKTQDVIDIEMYKGQIKAIVKKINRI